MNKKLLVLGATLLAGAVSAQGAAYLAGTANSDTFAHVTVVDPGGTPVANGGGYLGVGAFVGLDDAGIAALDGAGLEAAFTEYASMTFGGEGLGNSSGVALGSETVLIPASLTGQSVYFLIGDQAGFSGGAYAVVKEGSAFPADDPDNPVPIEVTWEISDVQEADIITGTFIAPGVVTELAGLVGVDPRASIGLIPEPSALVLSLAGLLMIFRRRR